MSQAGKLSREDFKRQKVIEEQRKASDPETGRDINPHIPQKDDFNESTIGQWYNRGTFFRKGACENCGAMTHKSRDCVDRPRKLGAKHTNKNIAPDELVQNIQLGFEAKRDRWNGYDPSDHSKVVEEYELIEQKRRQKREEEAQRKLAEAAAASGSASDVPAPKVGPEKEAGVGVAIDDEEDEDLEKDEDKYAESAEAVGQKLDTKSRTTVRNLRIREDTAKYLLNLDVNSAYYDPKTRSMRDNPNQEKDPTKLTYAGDNFVRWTGDAPQMAQLQKFAWDAADRGNTDVNLNANPTQGELLYRHQQHKSILEKYGGEEHLDAPPKELLLAQTEAYVEYSQTGKIIKGQERIKVRSKYDEDVFLLNHTSVWGSYWSDGRWGFACCHSFSKAAYCTGEAGKEAARASVKLLEGSGKAPPKTLLEAHLVKASKDLAAGRALEEKKRKGKGERLGEGDVEIDREKLKRALEEEDRRQKGVVHDDEDGGPLSKKKRTQTVTEEELEAYRMKKMGFEDPMANFKDDDQDA
ncbi:Pre-mRNA splicing Prp18-interacting factor-domain-containing protein [Zopfochytrium polystomum]|nr:Pre-mRNA splicing Prp18-interacting factor-domain-containing protein [Zopfochytrium polystomum]